MKKIHLPQGYVFDTAVENDMSALLSIKQAANERALGISGDVMWRTDHADESLAQLVSAGNCFVIKDNQHRIIATISVDEMDDYAWQNRGGDDGTALYFHKLMKDPRAPLSNSGKLLLAYTAQRAVSYNKQYLRADTNARMDKLIAYYAQLDIHVVNSFTYPVTATPGVLLEGSVEEILLRCSA